MELGPDLTLDLGSIPGIGGQNGRIWGWVHSSWRLRGRGTLLILSCDDGRGKASWLLRFSVLVFPVLFILEVRGDMSVSEIEMVFRFWRNPLYDSLWPGACCPPLPPPHDRSRTTTPPFIHVHWLCLPGSQSSSQNSLDEDWIGKAEKTVLKTVMSSCFTRRGVMERTAGFRLSSRTSTGSPLFTRYVHSAPYCGK